MYHRPISLDQSLVSDLRAAVVGDVLASGEEAYNDARAVWNGRIDRFPAVIVRVTSTHRRHGRSRHLGPRVRVLAAG